MPDSSLQRRPIAIRDKIPDKSPGTDNPGPGTYAMQNDAMQNALPRFTFKGPATRDFWLPRAAFDTPGPGQYPIESSNELPKWTIGKRSIQGARTAMAKEKKLLITSGKRTASSAPLAHMT
jgi:hypothetical protein